MNNLLTILAIVTVILLITLLITSIILLKLTNDYLREKWAKAEKEITNINALTET